ncbi:glycosyltransferase family 4 protein [Cellulomonas sp. APG4]|uniref:glycosyltransferase family 4 protein n=1 Tax=Cellulomonas sp. APG4 TaxID=1538656 RepID=UPI00137A2EFE|nr:glycosyltransferase family 4 protein [Cellulomonas sp. APG4]NCT91327.1 glycosyltransferase family 4 protein [Cellulomonas sp. APG4]
MTLAEHTPVTRHRVVMAVASEIERDARVKKTALAVADAGHDVTLVFGCLNAADAGDATLGAVRTTGLHVPYLLRDDAARRGKDGSRSRPFLIGFRDRKEMQAALLRSTLRSERAARRSPVHRALARSSAMLARVRGRLYREHVRRTQAQQADHAGRQRGRVDWRRALPNIGDLTLTFTKPLWRSEPDVIHIHDVHLLEAGALAKQRLLSQGKRVRLVYDAHEYIAGTSAPTPALEAAWKALEAEFMPYVDDVITVSEPIADAIQQRYGLERRPSVVLNTPTNSGQAPAASDIRTACGLPPSTTLLAYSGVLSAKRGIRTAIEGLADVPDAHLAVVCVPNAHYRGALALSDYAQTLGVADRVHLVEPVATDEIISFLSTADIGVHPMIGGLANHEMALPNKLFDYLFAGLPVVVSDVRLMGQFVRDHGVGEPFRPEDPADFARAVRAVMADEDRYRKNAARDDLRAELSWENQAEQIRALYADM